MVLAGMDPGVPAGLEHVDDRLNADIKFGDPHQPNTTLWILREAHLSARLQRNPWGDMKKYINTIIIEY